LYEQIKKNIWYSGLLLVAFIVFVVGLGYVLSVAYDSPLIFPLAILVAVASGFSGYYCSDKIILATVRARPAERYEFPHYLNSIEGLALAAGIPVPRAYVIDDPAPNAFASGRDPEHAVICVTTGLLGMMNRVETEGVIAHEMSHIKNYDIRYMAIVSVLVGTIAMLADWFWWRGKLFGLRSSRRVSVQVQGVFMLGGLVLAILAPISAALIQAAISRQREFLADANAALLTRYPDGLADALQKIADDTNKLGSANKAVAHLFIANPLKDHGGSLNSLFDTHPPIPERIKRLRAM